MSPEEMTDDQLKYAYKQLQQRLDCTLNRFPADARFQAAKAAMQGVIARDGGTPDGNAKFAVANADALLSALAPQPKPTETE